MESVEPRWIFPAQANDSHDPPVVVFCPTIVTDENEQAQRETITRLLDQLCPPCSPTPRRNYLLLLGVQHAAEDAAEARHRVETFARCCAEARIPFAAFTLAQRGKIHSLNVAIVTARWLSARALVQVDDDVYLEPGCIANLVGAFDAAHGEAVVGATKIGLARPAAASRLLRWLREQTGHACDYPHGCCLVFNPSRLPSLIPGKYLCDDTFLCLTFLRPFSPEPMALLRLAPSARCRFFVGGSTPGQSIRRIRRILLVTHILMADFPVPAARYYFRHLLFPGLWPFGVRTGSVGPASVGRWLLRFTYFCLFMGVGVELATRGLVGWPLRSIGWAAAPSRTPPRAAVSTASDTLP